MKKKIFTVLGLLMFLNLNFLFAQIPNDSALILKYSFTNGSLKNEADTTHNLTNYGATPTEDRYGIDKKALNFDGNDCLSAGAFSLQGKITFCAWVKVDQFENIWPYTRSVIGVENNGNYLLLRIGDANIEKNRPQFLISLTRRLESNTLLNANQYYFIVCTYDGVKAKIYIDGKLDAEKDFGTVEYVNINEEFLISKSCGERYMDGIIDDIRVYNRVLEIDEIQKIYSYKPYEDGLVVHFPFDGHVNDVSSNQLTGIAENVVPDVDRFNRLNSAYKFNYGSNIKAYYTNDLFPKDSSDRTISVWINSHQAQIAFGTGIASYLAHWGINQSNNASFIQLWSNNIRYGAWNNDVDYNYEQPLNQWINITCTYGNDTAKIYLNGQLVKTEIKENWNTKSSNLFQIGQGNICNSSLDDIRVYNKVMSAKEVNLLYNQNQINIAIPEGDKNVCSGTTSFYNVTKNSPITKWYLVPTDAGVLTDFDSIVKIEWANNFHGIAKLFASQLDSNYTYLHSAPLEIMVYNPNGIVVSTPSKPQGNTMVCNTNESTIVKTNSVSGANNYEWNIYPTNAGTIIGNDTIATINWNQNFKGNAFVSVKAGIFCIKSKESEYLVFLVKNIQNNYSMKFNPKSVVEIPKSNNIHLSNTTILIDIKADSISEGCILKKGGDVYNNTFYIYSSCRSKQKVKKQFIEFDYSYDCNSYYSNNYYNVDSLYYQSNEWHQLAITINSETDSAIYYIDGQKIYSRKHLNDLIYCNDSTSLFYIGNWYMGYQGDEFDGLLDNVTLYNRVLSQKEILERNQKLINPDTEDSLIFYYTFEEGAGNKVMDMSGNGYHGVSYGNPEYVNDVYVNNEYSTNNITGETTVVSNSNYIYTTTTVNNATSYAWHLIPSDAGTISGTDTSIIIDWRNDFAGIVKLVVNAVYSCEGNPSDTLVINVTNNTNIFKSEEKANFKIIPNPSKGNISIQTPETIELLEVYSIAGTKVFSQNELSNMQTIQLPIEKGMYIVKIKTQSGVKAQKLIIE